MKAMMILLLLCLALLPGCYVHTQAEVQGARLPADFSPEVLVVAVRDRVGLTESQVADLEQDAVKALTSQGIPSVSLNEAIGGPAPGDARDLLKRQGYLALLDIAVTSWGSKVEILSTSTGPSVGTLETGPDTSFFKPGSIEQSEYNGPSTTYKEVGITALLLDLHHDRVVWSAEIIARPAVIGRSCIYHYFNRNLQYEELAQKCFTRLADKLPRSGPIMTDSSR